MKKIFALLGLLLLWGSMLPVATAQQFTFLPVEQSKITTAAALKLLPAVTPNSYGQTLENVQDDEWGTELTVNPNWNLKFDFPVLYNLIKVQIDHGNKQKYPYYHYKITLNIKKFTNPSDQNYYTTETAVVDVEYDPVAGTSYKDKGIYKPSLGCHKFEVVIVDIAKVDKPTAAVPVPLPVHIDKNDLAENFTIERLVIHQRYDKKISPVIRCNRGRDNDQLVVNWGIMPRNVTAVPACHLLNFEAAELYQPVVYELEWLYIDDYTADLSNPLNNGNAFSSPGSSLNVPYNFRNNATRIRTYDRSYRIPLTYERGVIIYRIRALQPDINFQQLSPVTEWTVPESGTYDIGTGNCNRDADIYIISNAIENDKFNWQYKISFSEDAKYKHVINYFDGIYKNRQNITWLNSLHDNTAVPYVVAQENVFDLEGRPSIKTLPIPLQSPSLGYKPGLLGLAGGPLSAAQFDNPAARCAPVTIAPLSATAAGNQYYSPYNPYKTAGMDRYIPDAKGYPYIQTIYSPDNTDKIIWQGGAGIDHQPASGHATKFDYVRADQVQINKLLGTEGGYNQYYPKQIVNDPNGQTSFSVFDPNGKVVITGLSGRGPVEAGYPVSPLPEQPAPVPAPVMKELLGTINSTLLRNDIVQTTSFYNEVTSNTPAQVSHFATINEFSLCNQYLLPQLTYTTRLMDNCGTEKYVYSGLLSNAATFSSPNVALRTTATKTDVTNAGLGAQKYIAESYVTLDKAALRLQLGSFFDNNSGVLGSGKCYANASEFIHTSIISNTYPCTPAAPETVLNDCDVKRAQMIRDLYPGGKYGAYAADANGKFLNGAANSIFTFPPLSNPIPSTTTSGPSGTTTTNYNLTYANGTTNQCSVTGCNDPHTCAANTPGSCGCADGAHDTEHPCCQSCYQNKCKCIRFRYVTATSYTTTPDHPCNLSTVPATGIVPATDFPAYFGPASIGASVYIQAGVVPPCPGSYTGSTATLLSTITKVCECGQPHNVTLWLTNNYCSTDIGKYKYLILTDYHASQCGYTRTDHAPVTYPAGYRYQSDCITLPVPLTIGGQSFTSLNQITPQYLTDNFTDQIAEALLPLHPEYCKLIACDHYSEDLDKILTWQDAVDAGMSTLTDLVSHDPLRSKPGVNITVNDLSYPLSNPATQKLDNIVLSQTYCGCSVPAAYLHCISTLFVNEITNGILPGDASLKDEYWLKLKAAYTGNRNRLIYDRMYGSNATCGPCEKDRMTVIAPMAFNDDFRSAAYINGVVNNTDLNETLGSQPDVPSEILDLFKPTPSPSSISAIEAKALAGVGAAKKQRIDAAIDEMLDQLINCGLNAGNFRTSIRTSLDYNAPQTDIELTPGMVSTALSAGGVAPNDLCNTFLVDYAGVNNYSAKASGLRYVCKPKDFYTGFAAFLKKTEISTAITSAHLGTDQVMTLGRLNNFDNALLAALGYPPGTPGFPQLRIVSYKVNSGPAYVLEINLHPSGIKKISLCFNDQTLPAGFAVNCFNTSTVAGSNSRIATNMVRLGADVPGATDVYCWSKEWAFVTEPEVMNVNNTLTCRDASDGLDAYYAAAAANQYDPAANHPLFAATVTNYLNEKYRRNFAFSDYQRLFHGCAVSDVMVTPKHKGVIEAGFSSTSAAAAFYTFLKTSPALGHPISFTAYEDAGGWYFYVDLNGIPNAELRTVKDLIMAQTAGGIYRPAAPATPGNITFICEKKGGVMPSFPWLPGVTGQDTRLDPTSSAPAGYALFTYPVTSTAYASELAALKSNLALSGQANTIITGNYQVWRSADYSSTEKQAYLNYIRSLPGLDRAQVIGSVSPASLITNVYGSSKTGAYDELSGTGNNNSFYLTPTTGNSTVTYMLNKIMSMTGNRPFNFTGNTRTLIAPAPTTAAEELVIYKNADGSYWFRMFNNARGLYNIFVSLPEGTNAASLTYVSHTVAPAFDKEKKGISFAFTTGSRTVAGSGFITGITTPGEARVADVVLYNTKADNSALPGSCEYEQLLTDIKAGSAAHDNYRNKILDQESNRYFDHLAGNIKVKFALGLQDLSYNYTLYYYDQAGNLVKTVPPAGASPLSAAVNNTIENERAAGNLSVSPTIVPAHSKATVYKYNSRNQPIWQKSPDGGETYFFYDAQGRLRFSQNSRQRPLGRYSYMMYDDLSRIIETGEVKLDPSPAVAPAEPTSFTLNTTGYSYIDGGMTSIVLEFNPYVYYAGQWDNKKLNEIVAAVMRYDVVRTLYDEPVLTGATANLNVWHGEPQRNLRNRVSSLQVYDFINTTVTPAWRIATHFSYDAAGNVQSFIQDCPELSSLKMQYVRVDYDYDLASGKVNALSYNRGRPDQFYHRYQYDADNRLTVVETSGDGIVWDKDAQYEYYKHGPLARTRLGDLKVQSMEYAYTIQGWLKAINGETLHPETDMGENGLNPMDYYPKDVMAHTLDYYAGDYYAINHDVKPLQRLPEVTKGLYNGNIARQTTGIANPATPALQDMVRVYQYDQLNRLMAAGNQYAVMTGSGASAVFSLQSAGNLFGSAYSYDPDGNLKTLKRSDLNGNPIDDLKYNYAAAGRNRLTSVNDLVTTPAGSPDIHNQTDPKNYQYDGAGNLIRDISEGKTMTWNSWGKLSNIYDPGKLMSMNFAYDGTGNRFSKEVITSTAPGGNSSQHHESEYYVRDAAGQLLATYRRHSLWSALQLFTGLTTTVRQTTGGRGVAAEVIGLNYPLAASALISQSVAPAGHDWLGTRTENTQVSQILNASPDGFDAFMYTSAGYLDSLLAPRYDSLLLAAIGGVATGNTELLFTELTSGRDPLIKSLQYLCHRGGESAAFFEQVGNQVGVVFNGDCEETAAAIWDSYSADGEDRLHDLGIETAHFFMNNKEAARQFYIQLLHDAGYNALLLAAIGDLTTGNTDLLMSVLSTGRGPAVKSLEHLCHTGGESAAFFENMCEQVGAPFNGDCEDMSAAIWNGFGEGGEDRLRELADQMSQFFINNREVTDQFYSELLHDESIMDSIRYAGSQFEVQLQSVLRNSETSRKDLLNFIDEWPRSRSLLTSALTADQLGKALYSLDGGDYLAQWMDHTDGGGVEELLVQSGASPVQFAELLKSTGASMGYDLGAVLSDMALNPIADTILLAEHHIYGSSRLGIKSYGDRSVTDQLFNSWSTPGTTSGQSWLTANKPWLWIGTGALLFPDPSTGQQYNLANISNGLLSSSHTVGLKNYELTDHLGNVLVSVLDRKVGYLSNPSNTLYDYWLADIAGSQDYYPYGMLMAGRTYLPSDKKDYKFGFNGQMKDNEIAGAGNHLDFTFRGYDPRLGRFWSVDPIATKYPWSSSYAFAENDVIRCKDLEGLERVSMTGVNAEQRTASIKIMKQIEIVDQALPAQYKGMTTATIMAQFPNPTTPLYVRNLPANGQKVEAITETDYNSGQGYKLNVTFDISVSYTATNGLNNSSESELNRQYSGIVSYAYVDADYKWIPGQLAAGTQGGISVRLRPNTASSSGITGDETISHEVGWHNMANQDHKKDVDGLLIYPPRGTKTLESNKHGDIQADPKGKEALMMLQHAATQKNIETP